MRPDPRPRSDARVGADHGEGADLRGRIHVGRAVDLGEGMDPGFGRLLGMEERHRARVVRVRVLAHDAGNRGGVTVAGTQDHGARPRRGETAAILRIGEEGDVPGAGRIEGRHAREAHALVADALAAELRHYFTEGQGAGGHGLTGRPEP
ncbi:hypothetical protein D3C83_07970 [compost metagenome]